MEKLAYSRFIVVKDDFYDDPFQVYREAQLASYYEPKYFTGFRSRAVYHEPGVRHKLEKILGIKIVRWDKDPIQENGVFYQAFSNGKNKEVPGVHSDTPYNDITVVIYLTPDLPFDCGTSLWMHKKSRLCDPPTAADARKFQIKLNDLREQFEVDSGNRKKWLEIDRIGYRFNRMVAYPSGMLHSATNHYGGSINDVRLYQTFRIGVNWKSFKMKNS